MRTSLCFYGVGVRVEGGDATVHRALQHDFCFFIAPDGSDSFVVHLNEASADRGWRCWFRGGRSALYLSPLGEKRVNFFDKVAVSYHFLRRSAQLWSECSTSTYEVLYYVILSYVGERLDLKGWHRIHGFGFAGDTLSLMMASSGTGKSTLAWALMQNTTAAFYSDDVPLVNAKGEMRAFPQRIALVDAPNLGMARPFPRARNRTKYVVGMDALLDRIGQTGPLDALYWLRHSKRPVAGVQPAARITFLWPLVKWLVIGAETPQIWEFYLRLSLRDWFYKSKILWSRLQTGYALWCRTRQFVIDRAATPRLTQHWVRHHARL